MEEIKRLVTEQFYQLQMFIHRASFHKDKRGMHSPHRGQGRVLSILKIKPEISQKDLGSLLNISKQALTELISKLERQGYITRKPSEEDKRIMIIKITEEGMKAITDGDGKIPQTFKALDCLNDEELAAFSSYLDRIIKNYEKQFPGEGFEHRRKMMKKFMHAYGPNANENQQGTCCGFKGHGHKVMKD